MTHTATQREEERGVTCDPLLSLVAGAGGNERKGGEEAAAGEKRGKIRGRGKEQRKL
jgi:hypothetical protein